MAAMLDTNCMFELATPTCARVGSHTWLLCKLLVRLYRASRCGQPPAASLQAVGLLVLGLAGVCEQPPAASLQVVGPLVLGFGGMWAATRGFLASCRTICSMMQLVGHSRHVELASV